MSRSIEIQLARFFKSPMDILRQINVAPFPNNSFKNIFGRQKLWFATTLIKEGNKQDKYSVIKWGGTGVHKSEKTASIISVTEAIERWAIVNYDLRNSNKYGFHIDQSSNGVAAYPLDIEKAKQYSNAEALERHGFSQIALRPHKMTIMKHLPRLASDLISFHQNSYGGS